MRNTRTNVSWLWLILSFVWCSNAFCQDKNLKPISAGKKTILQDKLTIPAMVLVSYDKFGDEHSIKPCGTTNVAKFGKIRNLQIDEPTMFILPIGYQIPYLVFPGDNVEFYSVSKPPTYINKNLPTLKHVRNSQRTYELKFFEQVFDSIGPCFGERSYFTPPSISSMREAVVYHKSQLDKREAFLENRMQANLVGREFYNFTKEYFKYKFYDDAISSFNSKKFPDSSTRLVAIKLADSLIKDLNESDGYNYYSWYKALKNYCELKVELDKLDGQRLESVVSSINENLIGKARNFALFYLFKFLMDKKPELVQEKLNLLNQFCSDEDYVNYVQGNVFFTKNVLSKINNTVITTLKEKRDLNKIIDSHRGKVIYVDFWASWCLPCLEELPFSKKLIADFKNENVVFLFLSVDSYVTPWKNSIQSNDMEGRGLHYLIADNENNQYKRKYNIGTIPRYILINKTGEVVNSDAPRPSEKKTRELIVHLLKG
jgi:thiol-disulfide isomerase/thioredoxin